MPEGHMDSFNTFAAVVDGAARYFYISGKSSKTPHTTVFKQPKKYKTRLEKSIYTGWCAQDGCTFLPRLSYTHQLGNLELLGGDRRVGTLRNRVRRFKKTLHFFAAEFNLVYPY